MTILKEQHTQMIDTVLLPNHADQEHTYDFQPGTPLTQATDTAESVLGRIERTIGEQQPLVLDNPFITYPAAHILGIKITAVGEETLRKAIEERQRHAGFIRN